MSPRFLHLLAALSLLTLSLNARAASTAEAPAAPLPAIQVSPVRGLVATEAPGGECRPSAQAWTITNTGGSTVEWTAGKTSAWSELSATGGTLAPGASVTVTLALKPGALPEGHYADAVTFTNYTCGFGTTTRTVDLAVGSSVAVDGRAQP